MDMKNDHDFHVALSVMSWYDKPTIPLLPLALTASIGLLSMTYSAGLMRGATRLMDDKTEKNFSKHYSWVNEYNREAVWDWLDDYYEAHGADDYEKLADGAYRIIFWLLEEINRNKEAHFQGKPVYFVRVPHTQDNYYYKYDSGLQATDMGVDTVLKRNLQDNSYMLFTESEIKYFGLENCEKIQFHC